MILLATLNQLNGFIEFITGRISIFFGGFPFSYCVFAGNKKEGYCNKKEYIVTSAPCFLYSTARELLKFAIPPLYGKAGPIIITFLFRI